MINVNELRKGNLLCQVVGGNIHSIEGFLGETIYLNGGFRSNINSGWQGIAITEDLILENCGFVKNWEDGDEYPTYTFGDFICDNKFQPIDVGFHILKHRIEFIHDLQNAYYYLNNKTELQIKPL